MTTIKCPSCGANLEVPSSLTIAHCLFCGTQISISSPDTIQEATKVPRWRKLCEIALHAGNYAEALQHCNSILLVNPSDGSAWLSKAYATFWLGTAANETFGEAMQYLDRAEALGVDTKTVTEARSKLIRYQAAWLNQRGVKQLEHGEELYNIFVKRGREVWFSIEEYAGAKKSSEPAFLEAMRLFLRAAKLRPDDVEVLRNIKQTMRQADWISWSDSVHLTLSRLKRIEERARLESELAEALRQLEWAKSAVARTERAGGFLLDMRTKALEASVRSWEHKVNMLSMRLHGNT